MWGQSWGGLAALPVFGGLWGCSVPPELPTCCSPLSPLDSYHTLLSSRNTQATLLCCEAESGRRGLIAPLVK